jgi:hypothetical protein
VCRFCVGRTADPFVVKGSAAMLALPASATLRLRHRLMCGARVAARHPITAKDETSSDTGSAEGRRLEPGEHVGGPTVVAARDHVDRLVLCGDATGVFSHTRIASGRSTRAACSTIVASSSTRSARVPLGARVRASHASTVL